MEKTGDQYYSIFEIVRRRQDRGKQASPLGAPPTASPQVSAKLLGVCSFVGDVSPQGRASHSYLARWWEELWEARPRGDLLVI